MCHLSSSDTGDMTSCSARRRRPSCVAAEGRCLIDHKRAVWARGQCVHVRMPQVGRATALGAHKRHGRRARQWPRWCLGWTVGRVPVMWRSDARLQPSPRVNPYGIVRLPVRLPTDAAAGLCDKCRPPPCGAGPGPAGRAITNRAAGCSGCRWHAVAMMMGNSRRNRRGRRPCPPPPAVSVPRWRTSLTKPGCAERSAETGLCMPVLASRIIQPCGLANRRLSRFSQVSAGGSKPAAVRCTSMLGRSPPGRRLLNVFTDLRNHPDASLSTGVIYLVSSRSLNAAGVSQAVKTFAALHRLQQTPPARHLSWFLGLRVNKRTLLYLPGRQVEQRHECARPCWLQSR